MAVLLTSARESISPAERAAAEGRTQRRRPDVLGRRRGRLRGARLGGHQRSTRGLPPVRPGGHPTFERDLVESWGCYWRDFPLPRWGRGMQGWVVILKLLAVGAAAHRVGLPADQARAREHAGVDGGARPLTLEDGGDLAAEAAARLRGHARGGRGDVRRDDDVVHV